MTAPVFDLTALASAHGFIIQGDTVGDNTGSTVSVVGDINGDGIDDIVIGANGGDDGGDNAGEAYVIYGTNSTARGTLDLSDLAPNDGFIIQGDVTDDRASVVSAAGDINNDGIADIIVGARDGDDGGYDAGEAYIIYGTDNTTRGTVDLTNLTANDGFVIQGDKAGDGAGSTVSAAGDVNNDGIDDVIVGVPDLFSPGKSYVIYGTDNATRGTVDLTGFAASEGFVIQGDADGDSASRAFAAGDINGDGIADVIVGAAGADEDGGGDQNVGKAYVVYGRDSATRGTVDLADLATNDGFTIQGDGAFDFLGTNLSAAGDINGDGLDDILVGATNGDDGGGSAGEVYVIYGTDNLTRGDIDLTDFAISDGFIIQGDEGGDRAGSSVAAAGDINGDGIGDIIFGATGADGGGDYAGAAYVIYGINSSTRDTVDLTGLDASDGFVIQGDAESDNAGGSVSGAGDLNGDGIDDVIVGASQGGDGGTDAGEVYVIYGFRDTPALFASATVVEDGQTTLDLSKIDIGIVDTTGTTNVVISADAGTLTAESSAGVTVNSELDGHALTLTGTLMALNSYLDSDAVTYTTASNATDPDSVSVFVNDDEGGRDVPLAGIAIEITPVNDSPTATLPLLVPANEDTLTVLDLSPLNIVDVDATGTMRVVLSAGTGTLAATPNADVVVTNSSGGRVLTLVGTLAALNSYLDSSAVSYTGAANASAPDNVSVVINDDDGSDDVSVGSIAVTITPVNDAPVLDVALSDQAGAAGTALSFVLPTAAFSDVDGDTLILTTNALPSWLVFDATTGTFSGTPPQDAAGPISVTVTANDGSLSASETFVLTVGEVISGGVEDSTLTGGAGSDVVSAVAGSNVITGGDGNDLLGGGFDDDQISGGSGNDILLGDNSVMIAGADRLEGGTGDDLLQGGGGEDTFVFNSNDGDDTIGLIDLDYANPANSTVTGPDFVSGVDRIALNGFGLADGAAAYALVTDVDGVATFADQGTEITFAGLTAADLSADDFQIL